MSAATTAHGHAPYYFVPAPSRHPVLTATGLLFVIFGAGQWINGHGWGTYCLIAGFALWGFTLQQWFRQAIGESEGGLYGDRIDVSFRWSMSWFIFSEVMFFGAFFGALYLDAPARAAQPGQPGERGAVARLPRDLAERRRRRHRLAGRHRRPVPDHGPVADPDHQHRCCC